MRARPLLFVHREFVTVTGDGVPPPHLPCRRWKPRFRGAWRGGGARMHRGCPRMSTKAYKSLRERGGGGRRAVVTEAPQGYGRTAAVTVAAVWPNSTFFSSSLMPPVRGGAMFSPAL